MTDDEIFVWILVVRLIVSKIDFKDLLTNAVRLKGVHLKGAQIKPHVSTINKIPRI